jgi:Cys-tRNA(Pro)/Cys-tRNA(Cys) deacylase
MNDLHPAIAAALAASGIPHSIVRHADLGVPVRGPGDVAAACGLEIGQITKTLLLCARDGRTFVVVTPVLDRLPLRSLAAELKAGRLSLASLDTLSQVTGYPPAGVSPLGVPAGPRVLVAAGLLAWREILVGGGAPGVEVRLAAVDLVAVSAADVIEINPAVDET